jgi:hypothetical protein
MAARLGNVLYWLGCGLAFLGLVISACAWLVWYGGRSADPNFELGLAIIPLTAAIILWVFGRAARYVLAGR